MSSFYLARVRATLFVFSTLLLSSSASTASEPQELIVLRNGRILHGNVTSIGDEMIISFAKGGEMRISSSAVECRCRSLVEAYQLKRQQLDINQPGQRLDLAEWCIRHDLLKQAMDELLETQIRDPGNERIDRVRRQWILATQYKSAPQQVATTNVKKPISVEELDKLVRGLPPGAVEKFTSVIQPILVNSCATSDCHGSNSANDLRLIRPASRRILARRFTQRNLFSVLQTIDTDAADESQLLINSIRAHGSQQKPALGPFDRHQYQQLADWVRSISKKTKPRTPLKIAKRDTRVLQTSSTSPSVRNQPPAAKQAPAPKPIPAKPSNGATFVPADPFDPEIFNRRFHPPALRSP